MAKNEGVKIPLYLGLEEAFENGKAQVNPLMASLQKEVEKHPLNMRINLGKNGGTKTVSTILKSTTTSAAELNKALAQVSAKWNTLFTKAVKLDAEGKQLNDKEIAQLQKLSAAYSALYEKKNHQQQTINAAMKQGSAIESETAAKSTAAGNAAVASAQKQVAAINQVNAGYALQNSYLGRVLIRMAAYSAVFKLAGMVRSIRETTAEFELQRVALGALIQDAEKGAELFDRVKAAAVRSPFEIKDLVSYTKQLSAYQIETEDLYDTMMRLADISSGLGVDMNRLILAYGQVKAASVLRGQELRQFTEAGIPMVQMLADKLTELNGVTYTTGQVFDLISKKSISFEMVKEVLEDATNAGGMFYNMQEKQAATLAGQWSNLKDSVSIMYDEMGNSSGVHDAMTDIIDLLKTLAENWRTVSHIAFSAVGGFVAYKLAASTAALAVKALTAEEAKEALVQTKVNIANSAGVLQNTRMVASIFGVKAALAAHRWQVNALAAANVAASQATNIFTLALNKMKIALLSNPFTAIVAVIGTVIAALMTMESEEDKIKDKADEISKMGNGAADEYQKEADFGGDIVKAYTRIASKSNKTAQDMQRLNSIIDQAKEKYGDEVVKINEDTQARQLNIEAVERLSAAKLESMKTEGTGGTADKLAEMQAQTAKLEKQVADQQDLYDYWQKQADMPGAELFKIDRAEEEKEALDKMKESLRTAQDAVKNLQDAMNGAKSETTDTLEGWRAQLATYTHYVNDTKENLPVLSKMTIQGYDNEKEAMADVAKMYKDYAEQVQYVQAAILTTSGAAKVALQNDLKDLQSMKDVLEKILTDFNAKQFLNTKKSGGSSKTKADMYTELLKEQQDFLKDYQSNFEKLNKYLSAGDALKSVRESMKSRGETLDIDVFGLEGGKQSYADQLKALIDKTTAEVQKRFNVAKGKSLFEIMGIKTKDTELKKYLSTLTSLWEKYSDELVSITEQKSKAYLDYLSSWTKGTQVAKDFYDQMMDITGNDAMATRFTVAIYGRDGKSLKEDVQDELYTAFENVDLKNIKSGSGVVGYLQQLMDSGVDVNTTHSQANYDKIIAYADTLIESSKWGELEKLLDLLPEEQAKAAKSVLDTQKKADADWLNDLVKTYQKAKTYNEQIADIDNKATAKKAEIDANNKLSPEEKKTYKDAVDQKAKEDKAAVKFEELKNTSDWVKAFEDLDRIGNTTIEDLIVAIDELIAKQKEAGYTLSPENLKSLEEAKTKLVTKREARSPYASFASGASDYKSATKDIKLYREELSKLTQGTDEYKQKEKELKDAENKQRKGLDKMRDAVNNANDTFNAMGSAVSSVQTIFQSLGGDDSSAFAAALEGIGTALTIVGAGLTFVNAVLTLMETNPIVLAISAIVAGIAAIFTVWSSVKVAKANKQIEEQQKLLDEMSDAYDRLEDAQESAFGNDYITNYQQELKILAAESIAYQKQAAAERSKGKKADEDKISDYEQSYRDALQQIEDMETELSEHFTGTTLADAARDFAESWIEAYKEFSSTSDAMSEKFNDMIESMITESLAAKMIQTILQPLFDEIDELSADGELSAEDIAKVAGESKSYVDLINTSMTGLMNQLGAAGLSIRSSSSGLTGISKDIAEASEESILGLAAGINTQNFYISQIYAITQQILAAISGNAAAGTQTAATTKAMTATVQSSSTTSDYMSYLPTIADNTANTVKECQNIVSEIKKVIVPKSSSGNGYKVMIS